MAEHPPDSDLLISYRTLRKALGCVAITMPIAVKFGAYWFEGIPSHESISAYYYTSSGPRPSRSWPSALPG